MSMTSNTMSRSERSGLTRWIMAFMRSASSPIMSPAWGSRGAASQVFGLELSSLNTRKPVLPVLIWAPARRMRSLPISQMLA